MSFVERFIILCPYLGESTVRVSTVLQTSSGPAQDQPMFELLVHLNCKGIFKGCIKTI